MSALNSDQNTALWVACFYGHLSAARLLVNRGSQVEAKGRDGWTSLLAASSNNQSGIVSFLLSEAQASIHAVSTNQTGRNTALHLAAIHNCKTVASVLINYKKELLTVKNGDGNTPLWMAAAYGNAAVTTILIESGSDVDSVGSSNYTALMAAILNRHLPTIRILINSGASLSTMVNGENVLHLSAANGFIQETGLILELKPQLLDSLNTNYETPIYKARYYGKVEVMHFLISKGADVNIMNRDEKTAFTAAAINGELGAMKELLNSGIVKLNQRDGTGRTPLQWVIHLGALPAVQLLVDRGADLEDRSVIPYDFGAMSIHLAAWEGHVMIVRYLLEVKPTLLEAKSDSGETPLFYSCRSGALDSIRLFLRRKANVKQRDEKSLTPFLAAVANNQIDSAKILVENIGNVVLEDVTNGGDTALHIASQHGFLRMVEFLASKISRTKRNNDGATPLWLAVANGHTEVVTFLSNDPQEIDIEDIKGLTPLHIACRRGYTEIAKILFRQGANVFATTQDHEAVVHSAVRSCNKEVLKIVLDADMSRQLELTSENGSTPLCLAAKLGCGHVSNYLLDHGANVEASCYKQWTPLMIASFHNQLSVVMSIVHHGANLVAVTATCQSSNNAFHLAGKFFL